MSVKALKQYQEDIKNKVAVSDRIKYVDEVEPTLFAQIGSNSITFYCQVKRGVKENLGTINPQVPPREFIADLREKSRSLKDQEKKDQLDDRLEKKLPATEMTLRQFLKHHYVIETAIDGGLKTKDNEDVKRIYRDFESLLDKKLGKFTKGDIEEWKANTRNHLSNSTKRRSYNSLRALFNHAVNKELIQYNPISGIKIKEENSQKYRVLKADEIDKIIENVASRPRRDRVIFQILLLTGCRTGELFPMKVEDIIEDGDNSRIRIFNTEINPRTNKRQVSKSGKYREVQIGAGVYHEIQELLEEENIKSGNIFLGSRGEPLKSFRSPIKTISKHTGVYNWSPYCFRHTFASTLINNGVNLVEIRDRLGHHSIIQTVTYIDRLGAQNPDTVKDLSNIFNISKLSGR